MRIDKLLGRSALALTGAALLFASGSAFAQNWPTKPVRMIIPFGTGGGTDIQGRLLSANFQKATGQRFIVENRAGAGGLIGAEYVSRASNDGHTLLFTTATLAINTTLFQKTLKFSTRDDLVPSTLVSDAPNVLCVHPSVPAKSVSDLLALARKHPGRLNNGVNTPGSTSHFAAELFRLHGKLDTVIVPFTGGGPAAAALITGDIDMLFATGPVAAANKERIRCLGVTTPERNPSFPDLPTINTFVPGVEIGNWYGMFFPRGTAGSTVQRMSDLVKEALSDPKVKEFFGREGIVGVGSTPAQFRKLFHADIERYAQVIKAAGIHTQ
jgi:tripartite-type tricarboxylate transporter receptor subunit TctC